LVLVNFMLISMDFVNIMLVPMDLLHVILVSVKNEMGGACGAYGRGERRVQGYGGET
jgi:hypothetical protein